MNANKESQRFGNILVVDDEETMRRSLADILRLEGYQVKAVSGGEAALEALRAAGRPGAGRQARGMGASAWVQEGFDVMLLDLKMPDVDGLDVLKAASRIAPDTMVILLTAHGSLESAIEAIHYKAHDYLLKPASPQQIINSVTKAIGRRAELLHKRALLEQRRAAQGLAGEELQTGSGRLTADGLAEDSPGLQSAGRYLPDSEQVRSGHPGGNSAKTVFDQPSAAGNPQPLGQGVWQDGIVASEGSSEGVSGGEAGLLEPRLIALANDVVVDLARREMWRLIPSSPANVRQAASPRKADQKAGQGPGIRGREDSRASEKGNEERLTSSLQRGTEGGAGEKVRLTPTEGKLLKVLLENRGRVLTHRELVLMVQGYDVTDWEAPEVLRPVVSRLRQKLKHFPGGESWIVNVRGTGYALERRQQDQGPMDGVERRQRRGY